MPRKKRVIDAPLVIGDPPEPVVVKVRRRKPILGPRSTLPVPRCCYPIMIFSDRYLGEYSGGRWIALIGPREPFTSFFEESQSSDRKLVQAFWATTDVLESWGVGVADTPDQAVAAVMKKALDETW